SCTCSAHQGKFSQVTRTSRCNAVGKFCASIPAQMHVLYFDIAGGAFWRGQQKIDPTAFSIANLWADILVAAQFCNRLIGEGFRDNAIGIAGVDRNEGSSTVDQFP